MLSFILLAACSDQDSDLPVIVPGTVITMDDSRLRAEALAMQGDRILAVGSLQDLKRQYPEAGIDRRFDGKVIMPGFIEPHLHPYIAGLLLPLEFITPHPWDLPGKDSLQIRGQQPYRDALRDLDARLPEGEWLKTWGYHHLWHGEMSRHVLDGISKDRPIMVWQRSMHEIYLNTAALDDIGMLGTVSPDPVHANIDEGHFFENGIMILLPKMIHTMSLTGYVDSLDLAADLIEAGGITTVGDGAFGTINPFAERWLLKFSDWTEAPFDTWLLPDGKVLTNKHGIKEGKQKIEALAEQDMDQIRFSRKQVKFFADGAAYSQLMQMTEGYTDGHQGAWMMTPPELEAAMRPFWLDNYQIHVHVNGDAGLDVLLDIVTRLQAEYPRRDHRTTVHHLAYARKDQASRMAALGMAVSANPYYVWALANAYADRGLGPERAQNMVPLRDMADAGVSIALHSDFTMAPAKPLLLAWSALTRLTSDGNVMGNDQAISLDLAMAGITREAAWQMGQEQEIGSLEPGKKANLVILAEDPWAVAPEHLKDINIEATVYAGRLDP